MYKKYTGYGAKSSVLNKLGKLKLVLGFSVYRIVMPEELQQISSTLKTFGLGKYVNSIEKHMNTGAEMASAEAKGVFIQAISDMSVSDALGILRGGDNAATNYFKIGFYDEVKQFRGLYDALPINNKPSLNLEQHVVDKSLAAVFDRFSAEEAAIRADPLKKGTEFLSKIYAAARSSAK